MNLKKEIITHLLSEKGLRDLLDEQKIKISKFIKYGNAIQMNAANDREKIYVYMSGEKWGREIGTITLTHNKKYILSVFEKKECIRITETNRNIPKK